MTIEELHVKFLECSGVSTDSRTVPEGCLFFALKGPNFDANTFAGDALKKGARYAVVDDPDISQDDRCLFVPDTLKALQELARYHRRRFDIPVIGITGTNGKTTTKELMAAVLGSTFPTLATTGNLNNHIGVPLTLLRLTGEHKMAIIEMGANKPGDIAELAAIAEPTHGLITNIGKAHLEGFGDYQGVLRTKTELYDAVKAGNGLLFVNSDDPVLLREAQGARTFTYGTTATAEVHGRTRRAGQFLSLAFVGVDNAEHGADLRLIGDYNLPNALSAVAVGRYFGVPDEKIAKALAAYQPGNNRSQFKDTGKNHLVLDAYNANPTSMAAALENFAHMASDRPKLVILGDMLELGNGSAEEHATIVALVERAGLRRYFVGPRFSVATGNAPRSYPDAASLLAELGHRPINGYLVLLKGSRGIGLETLVPAL